MSVKIKSFSVNNGDTFYIKHASDNFTIIDCNLEEENKERIVNEICVEKRGKSIIRFISTHPDIDHIRGIKYLDEKINILNFYCIKNNAIKDESEDFLHYCSLRDSKKAYYIEKGCKRKWMNLGNNERGESGIEILWPNRENQNFRDQLIYANVGVSYNNISPVIKYSLERGVTVLWFGDLEKEFMERIIDDIELPNADIVFAPHHGRESGELPQEWLEIINPKIIIIGEAASKNICYYPNYNTITQNSAKDITMICEGNKVHFYSSNYNYGIMDFLINEYQYDNTNGYYIGTLIV